MPLPIRVSRRSAATDQYNDRLCVASRKNLMIVQRQRTENTDSSGDGGGGSNV